MLPSPCSDRWNWPTVEIVVAKASELSPEQELRMVLPSGSDRLIRCRLTSVRVTLLAASEVF